MVISEANKSRYPLIPYGCRISRKPNRDRSDTLPGFEMKTLSFSKQAGVVEFCEKSIAMDLIQDWCFQTK